MGLCGWGEDPKDNVSMILNVGTHLFYKAISEGQHISMLLSRVESQCDYSTDSVWTRSLFCAMSMLVTTEAMLEGRYVVIPEVSGPKIDELRRRYGNVSLTQRDIDDLFAELGIELDQALEESRNYTPDFKIVKNPELQQLRKANESKTIGQPCWRCTKPLSVVGSPPKAFCGACETALEKVK